MSDTTLKTRFRVEGMDCASCARKVETAARRIVGVDEAVVSVTAETLTLTHHDNADLDALARTLGGLGYPAVRIAAAGDGAYAKAPVDGCSDGCCCGRGHAGDGRHGHHEEGSGALPSKAPERGGRDGHADARDPADGPAHALGQAGAHGHDRIHVRDHGMEAGPWWRTRKALLTLSAGGAVAVAAAIGRLMPDIGPALFVAALAVGLVPIARRALLGARAGTPFSIEMLMTIAAVGAVFLGAVEEAATVVLLFLVGELLEGFAASRARASIRGLAALVPKTARVVGGDGAVVERPADALAIDDIFLVRPGDRIAADGTVVDGASAVDEAPVTGESVPKPKESGDAVFAGTVNGDGVLRIRVTASATDNTISRVVRLVEEAQESKAPTERFIDRFARHYTPAVVAVAALVALVPPLLGFGPWEAWIYKGLAILLIGCPCALVISTPAAIAAGLAAGARRGLLMKGGAVLERVGRLTTIALDKTGTLTEGRPRVTDVVGFGIAEREVVARAAALEAGSNHPLAAAILARASADGLVVRPAADIVALPGRGVEGRIGAVRVFLGSPAAAAALTPAVAADAGWIAARTAEGKSVAVVVEGDRSVGAVAMRDEPRPDARRGLDALKDAGVTPLMLTGDGERTASAIAADLGIEARAGLLPEDKQAIVRALQAEGRIVGKVGDGINDAPALAAADVGIAMGGGTDVALETADAAILHGRMTDVAAMVRLSRATMANIRQNVAIALGLKAVFLVTTVVGVTGLWPAVLADTGATVLVTMNAMRLLGWRGAA